MTPDATLWSFIINAGFVVKLVMLILLLASVASWMIIFQRIMLFRETNKQIKQFEEIFWSGINLNELAQTVNDNEDQQNGNANIFNAGFNEYQKLKQQPGITPQALINGSQRAMKIAQAHELQDLQSNISFLATVGSTSPYVGLFGTVWGIMTAFRALGTVQQATIAMVSPGIAEALIATAIGLFAAIPAVIAYNRFNNELEKITDRYEIFQEEFINILHRQAYYSPTQEKESENATVIERELAT